MILAAGFGTRLGALSDERPKPLLPVADVALIRYAIALLVGHGVRDIVVNLHHRGELIVEELGDGAALGARIVYSQESTILGTGGGIRRALPLLGESTFLVVNGKILVDLDLHALLAQHRASGAAATLVVRADPEAAKWNAIDAPAEGGPIRSIFGAGDFMFTGIHAIEPSLVARLPDDGAERCIIRQGYVPWMAEGVRVDAFVQRGYFMEHSTPERYLAGNVNVLRGVAAIRHAPGALVGVDASAQVDASATILPPVRVGPGAVIGAGCVVGPDTVVGAGAEVAPGVTLERCVVWPKTRVAASARSAILTPRGGVVATSSGS
jgi:NDP-sugar pyrophosphorylase family protein